MPTGARQHRDISSFVPRVTITIAVGMAIFVSVALLYSLPVMLEEPPPNAIQDWTRERVRAHLEGKAMYLLLGSFLLAAVLSARGWIPGTRAPGPRAE